MKIDGHNCWLVDDGTLDTVISVDGEEVRFDCEYASEFRDTDGSMTETGFLQLAEEAIDSLCW